VHEFAHALFCKITGTPVSEVCYFQLGNPAGYVLHAKPANVWHHILIGIGPLFVNTLLGFALGFVTAWAHVDLDEHPLMGVLWWLSVSIAMHSFPSVGDAKSIWQAVWSDDAPFLATLIGTPLAGLIVLGAVGSIAWLDLLYGLCVAVGLPMALTS
jgi:hypothetical protein